MLPTPILELVRELPRSGYRQITRLLRLGGWWAPPEGHFGDRRVYPQMHGVTRWPRADRQCRGVRVGRSAGDPG